MSMILLLDLCRLELCACSSKITDVSVLYGIASLPKLLILGLPRCEVRNMLYTFSDFETFLQSCSYQEFLDYKGSTGNVDCTLEI
jgi:hypothetical protein